MFSAQLKSRVKGTTESISELTQAIKRLSRQSYPIASLDVIKALALDHFIDALTESDIRLRIREVGPKSFSEAEVKAIRLEAHRIADRQQTRLVGKIEQEGSDGEQKRVQNQKIKIPPHKIQGTEIHTIMVTGNIPIIVITSADLQMPQEIIIFSGRTISGATNIGEIIQTTITKATNNSMEITLIRETGFSRNRGHDSD